MAAARAAASLLACILVIAAGSVHAENVVTITGEASFKEAVSSSDFVVMEFYAPWCGHCKKLAPEFEKAATALKAEGSTIVLAAVDATDDSNKELASKFGVRGYPTLKVFRGGDDTNAEDYEGPREADGIIKHVKKISGPASAAVESADAVTAFIESEDAPVVAYFPATEGEQFDAYMKEANVLRNDFSFAHVTDASFLKDCPDCVSGSVVAWNKLEKSSAVFTGDFAGFKEWVEGVTKPSIITFGDNPLMRKALGSAFGAGAPTKIVGMASSDGEDTAMLEALMASSKEHDDLTFMYADKSMELFDRVKQYFDIEDEQLPAFVANNEEGKWHLFSAETSALGQFVKDFKDGKLEKTVKSAEIPAEPYEDDVRVVVAKQFDEIIFSGKDVLIEFYAPWCGHCKNLAPAYSEVGAAFKDNDKVEIAKMDATANDVTSSKFNVKGFPTIYFVKGSTGDVISYDGSRDKDGFMSFIKKHASASEGTHDEL